MRVCSLIFQQIMITAIWLLFFTLSVINCMFIPPEEMDDDFSPPPPFLRYPMPSPRIPFPFPLFGPTTNYFELLELDVPPGVLVKLPQMTTTSSPISDPTVEPQENSTTVEPEKTSENLQPCVYIAPLKALVRERIEDWNVKLGKKLGKRVLELTGDVTPDLMSLKKADLIVTTPEKWDGISRSWKQRNYVQQVALIIIDEIHLLGEERGPVLEVLVSRANYIASRTLAKTRLIGLSTALANAHDLAAWLRVPQSNSARGLFNFRPSVRPVPLEVHIQGFPGRHYCPRMATMNRPIFNGLLLPIQPNSHELK
ncbi:activating signal cointegrator 1 complex subunit [Cichlidogyrus casuarinus]|uniref:Activating signal cointegrator 1 complex subunit n=1 Tax=Cichlidogyrus casuarinus TaxID=1844966 RepID=A0ABD2PQI2_9PLAT